MRIATLTFHAAHNYGSVLQAYALKTFVEELCRESGIPCEYSILNYRSAIQKQMYRLLPRPDSCRNVIKLLMRLLYLRQYRQKERAFEDFIAHVLPTTEEVGAEEALRQCADQYDLLLCGSDQIWNVRAADATPVYYLNFTDKPKCSYAASFGPLKIDWEKHDRSFCADALRKFTRISVREEGSADNVEQLLGKRPEVHIDPTLLLDREHWLKLAENCRRIQGRYILLYCLEPSPAQLRSVETISRQLGLPVIMTRYNNRYDYFNRFQKYYSAGPKDFISLAANADFVVTSSFHGTAFSVIFERPFYVLDGMNDNRIRPLLKLTGLEERTICSDSSIGTASAYDIDFFKTRQVLEEQREKSRRYLLEVFHAV